MTKDILEIVSSIGISGLVVVVAFYFWLKKAITSDIVEPLIKPMKLEIEEVKKEITTLKEELNRKDDKLEKINDMILKNTETLNELKTIFNLIKGKIEIKFKHEDKYQ